MCVDRPCPGRGLGEGAAESQAKLPLSPKLGLAECVCGLEYWQMDLIYGAFACRGSWEVGGILLLVRTLKLRGGK